MRLVAVAAALVVAAWFGLGIVQARATDAAATAIGDGRGVASARAGLGVAEWLRPGQDPALLRAQLDFLSGRTAAGRAAVRAIVRAEPDYLSAWRLESALTSGAEQAAAKAQIRRLSPDVPTP